MSVATVIATETPIVTDLLAKVATGDDAKLKLAAAKALLDGVTGLGAACKKTSDGAKARLVADVKRATDLDTANDAALVKVIAAVAPKLDEAKLEAVLTGGTFPVKAYADYATAAVTNEDAVRAKDLADADAQAELERARRRLEARRGAVEGALAAVEGRISTAQKLSSDGTTKLAAGDFGGAWFSLERAKTLLDAAKTVNIDTLLTDLGTACDAYADALAATATADGELADAKVAQATATARLATADLLANQAVLAKVKNP